MFSMTRRLLPCAAGVLLVASCSGSGSADSDDTVGTGEIPDVSVDIGMVDDSSDESAGTTSDSASGEPAVTFPFDDLVVACDAEASPPASDWPFLVSESITVLDTSITGFQYAAVGVTDDVEGALIETMGLSFDGFDAGDPEGSDTEVSVTFTSDIGSAELKMSEIDTGGCWKVLLSAAYLQTPEPVVSASSETLTPDPLDQLASVGTGEIITRQGTFPFVVTACNFSPLAIEATAREGTLTLRSGDNNAVIVAWNYGDGGVQISDEDAKVLAIGATSGSFVANGSTPDGPETLIVEVTC